MSIGTSRLATQKILEYKLWIGVCVIVVLSPRTGSVGHQPSQPRLLRDVRDIAFPLSSGLIALDGSVYGSNGLAARTW